MLPEFSLAGKIALVTGGGRGIGRAIALALAKSGADVVVAARTAGQVQRVAWEIEALGRRSLALMVDVSRRGEVEDMVERTLSEFGQIDVLVNNAGIHGYRGPALECSEEDWDTVIDVNLKGVFLCSQAVGRVMVRQGRGSIVNVSSRNAQSALGGSAAYCTSKAGVWMLTRSFARELAPNGVRVNAVGPGAVATDMMSLESRKAVLHLIPMGRWGEPEDIATVVVFLASDAARYMTGEIVYADGGRSA